MTREEAFKLTPEISYVIFAKGKYRVAYVAEEFGVTWIGIYDEPPSLHTDRIQAGHCELSLPPAEGAEKLKEMEELFNLEQQLDIPMKDRFHNSAKGKELLAAIQNKPHSTAEGAEEISNAILAAAHDYDTKIRNHEEETADSDDYMAFVNGAQWMREFAAQQQPTAEGAEEILESIVESLGDPINIHNHIFEIRPYTVEHKTEWWIFHKEVCSGEPLAQWLSKFATLHAQRIAEKMVSERLREELMAYDKFLSNTYWGVSHLVKRDEVVDEYLKTREK